MDFTIDGVEVYGLAVVQSSRFKYSKSDWNGKLPRFENSRNVETFETRALKSLSRPYATIVGLKQSLTVKSVRYQKFAQAL